MSENPISAFKQQAKTFKARFRRKGATYIPESETLSDQEVKDATRVVLHCRKCKACAVRLLKIIECMGEL